MSLLERACVHSFGRRDTFLVVDGNSGTVHRMDHLAFLMVGLIQEGCAPTLEELYPKLAGTFARDEVAEAFVEIEELIEEGCLFSSGLSEVPKGPDSVVKALCLHVAHDCNLHCRYCFAQDGGFGGERNLMPLSVAKASIDFLIGASRGRRHIEVDFFGGEPLMNFEVVRQTVEYGQQAAQASGKELRFTLTTNGVGLTPMIEQFLHTHMDNVVLSLDGRPHINDRNRCTVSGDGSVYSLVVPKYQRFVAGRGGQSYFVRGTFTRDNLDFAEDVLHLVDLGFSKVSVEPVVAAARECYALTWADVPRILAEYERLTDICEERWRQGRPFVFFHFQVDLMKGPCLYKRLSGCGAGDTYLAVAPDGSLYPCHQFVGEKVYRMGDVQFGLTNHSLRETLQQAHVLHKPTCTTCWAKYYCSGGCHANNLRFQGDLHTPYGLTCALERKRLECGLFLAAVREEIENEGIDSCTSAL